MATENILQTSKIIPKNHNDGMVLIWSRHDYNHDLESANNKDITWISIESKTIDKKFFSGKNLEIVITNLQKDSLALTCWISKDLTRILISKKTICLSKHGVKTNNELF